MRTGRRPSARRRWSRICATDSARNAPRRPQSAVRKSLGDFAPKLVDLTEDVLFGDVWERPHGVTREELVEMITHLAFYVGRPNARSAVNRAKALLASER